LRVISSETEEINILFSTPNPFKRCEKEGIIDMLTIRANEDNLKVRILVDHSYEIKETLERLMKKYPQITIRNLKSVQTKVNTIVADNELSLVIELKDDLQQNSNEAIGLAIYSNSESTVLSYASIFETLWIQSKIAGVNT
jgi:two-component system, OmpR family, sensor histidine kinase VicK